MVTIATRILIASMETSVMPLDRLTNLRHWMSRNLKLIMKARWMISGKEKYNTVIYGTPVMQMNEKRLKWRKNQTEKRKRLILERPAPDYPDKIDTREHWDEIIVRRHSPPGRKGNGNYFIYVPD
jgi:hypothetical protein